MLPDGSSGYAIREFPREDGSSTWLKIDREGDTVTVSGNLPGNEFNGHDVVFVRDYNWATVSWGKRFLQPAPTVKGAK